MTALQKETSERWPDGSSRRLDLLARLSTDPQVLAAGRHFLPPSAEARLSALLTEIDEIVLPRLLHLHSGLREVACLTVSHRCLIRIDMPNRSALPDETADLPGRFADRLIEIAETQGDLRLSIGRRHSQLNHAEIRCSVTRLRRALALATTECAFDRLQQLVGAQCQAQLVWAPGRLQPQFSGLPEWDIPLQKFAGNCRVAGREKRPDACVGPLRTTGIVVPVTEGQVLVFANLEEKGFAAILRRDVGLDMISSWQNELPRQEKTANRPDRKP